MRRNDRRPGSGESWRKGAEGEATLAGRLHAGSTRGQYEILHDRTIPGTRANIDHIVVARTGIYVIDAKKYKGRLEQKVSGFGRNRVERLVVNGRERTKLATAMGRQCSAVAAALADCGTQQPEVYPVLCFVDGEWELFASPFTIGGVRVMGPRSLVKALSKDGPIGGTERAKLARLLAPCLPAAVAG